MRLWWRDSLSLIEKDAERRFGQWLSEKQCRLIQILTPKSINVLWLVREEIMPSQIRQADRKVYPKTARHRKMFGYGEDRYGWVDDGVPSRAQRRSERKRARRTAKDDLFADMKESLRQ